MSNAAAIAHATSRFGMGARPDTPLAGDPAAWLAQQLVRQENVSGPSVKTGLGLLANFTQATDGSSAKLLAAAAIHSLFTSEVQAYMMQAVSTALPFRERLVRFWANHFAIMADTVPTFTVAGAFVRDAIRPYVTGKFSDMAQAVVTHPAMLFSLNAETSSGPASQASRNAIKRGQPGLNINENLGRELLELYTVGIGAGYAQADVDGMATLLTGFRVSTAANPVGFVYVPAYAQPGNSTVLGQSFPNSLAGCLGAVAMLATQPATYNHLATKLAIHFTSDTPAASDIAAIQNALTQTGGNLGAAAQAILSLPNAWVPLTKLRTPQDYIIAALRASNCQAGSAIDAGGLAWSLGEPVFQPPFPNGWSDVAADWTGPAVLGLRAGMAQYLATQTTAPAPDALSALIGPLMTSNTRSIVASASTPASATTLLLSSPEFQRR